MKYDKIVEAIFIERPNRFIARVKIDGAEEVELVHVKNTAFAVFRSWQEMICRSSTFSALHKP